MSLTTIPVDANLGAMQRSVRIEPPIVEKRVHGFSPRGRRS